MILTHLIFFDFFPGAGGAAPGALFSNIVRNLYEAINQRIQRDVDDPFTEKQQLE